MHINALILVLVKVMDKILYIAHYILAKDIVLPSNYRFGKRRQKKICLTVEGMDIVSPLQSIY